MITHPQLGLLQNRHEFGHHVLSNKIESSAAHWTRSASRPFQIGSLWCCQEQEATCQVQLQPALSLPHPGVPASAASGSEVKGTEHAEPTTWPCTLSPNHTESVKWDMLPAGDSLTARSGGCPFLPLQTAPPNRKTLNQMYRKL